MAVLAPAKTLMPPAHRYLADEQPVPLCDLQFLIGYDGFIVIADPLRVSQQPPNKRI
ncbi:hypothetical protein Plim_1172 [Planctopirus limnophila DSM 3776]|uniref:Uncharacterized protein n=1 Tax=Planctopirus limnophila (strain ATCC 43296 / DSM 3776 / IFAM 1008 / Mu 290) TaxID=521674 RepID=D5SU22_PLAL2|nr:hypothetical protein Plim_1172 [Planctopirus limnophila DSM 3776]